MLLLVLLQLLDSLFNFAYLTLILLALALEFCQDLFVLRFKLLNTILHTLYVQFKLLLDPNMLSNVCLQVLNQLLVHFGARRHRIRRVQ